MERHWDRARVEAEMSGPNRVGVTTAGITALTLSFPPGRAPFDVSRPVVVTIDRATVEGRAPQSDRSWSIDLRRTDEGWTVGGMEPGLRKRHGVTGPIDDAFLDRFVMVRPTGTPMNEAVGNWADAEMKHAITHWRQQFRGEAIVKNDMAITDADIETSNLVLWGDPSSNAILAKIVARLPVTWTKNGVVVGGQTYPADTHVPVLIYPNPMNPTKYVVLNSGFTFREYDYLNNARQVPKLPDWAVVDVTTPMTSRAPGKVVAGGFFDESWKLPK
jgi:hypothetical protein